MKSIARVILIALYVTGIASMGTLAFSLFAFAFIPGSNSDWPGELLLWVIQLNHLFPLAILAIVGFLMTAIDKVREKMNRIIRQSKVVRFGQGVINLIVNSRIVRYIDSIFEEVL